MAQFLSVWIIICVFGVFTVASDGKYDGAQNKM